jgi:hypothetical protein
MKPALHEQLRPPLSYEFFYLYENFFTGQDVSVWVRFVTVKSAERAFCLAYVRIVYIPVDDESHDIFRVQSSPDAVGKLSRSNEIGFRQKPDGFVPVYPFTYADFFSDGVYHMFWKPHCPAECRGEASGRRS